MAERNTLAEPTQTAKAGRTAVKIGSTTAKIGR